MGEFDMSLSENTANLESILETVNNLPATNWTVYADQIREIEAYPDICGGNKR